MMRKSLLFLVLAVVVLAAGCSREQQEWEEVSQKHDSKAYEAYLTKYPAGAHLNEARRGLDDANWEEAQATGTAEALRGYLNMNPDGQHTQQANEAIDRLERVLVPEELQSALDALVPESRFVFHRLRTSGPAPGELIRPPLHLVICGNEVLANNDDEKLARAAVKPLGKPLFTSSHAYIRSPGTLSGMATATSKTTLPGGVTFIHEENFLPGNMSFELLWAQCTADLKSNLPGLIVSSRTDNIPKDPDLVEVKFGVVNATPRTIK